MADDDLKVHMGEGSPEYIAHRLYHEIMGAEKLEQKDRKYRLDLFAECIHATKGFRDFSRN